MKTIFKIFAFCLLAQSAHSQACDTTGILLELQATTNLQGILFGDNRCLTTATVLAPLYVSNDTLRIDTTGLGGGGGGATDIYYVDNGGNDVDITSSTGSGFKLTGLGNIQIYENAAGEVSIDGSGIPSSKWTDAGVFTYLTSTTDRAVVGSATEINTAYIFQAKGGIFSQGAGSTSATYAGVFEKADGTDILNIRNDGRVGILNSAPTYTLDVVGDIRIDQPSAYYLETTKMAYGKPANHNYYFGGAGNATGNATKNIAIGTSALLNLGATGGFNVAIGFEAGKSITTGQGNVAIGNEALKTNAVGNNNFALGTEALKVATGSLNVAVGGLSQPATSTGEKNVSLGYFTLNANTTGFENIAVGNVAMQLNVDGYRNLAIGSEALLSNVSGYGNISIGQTTLYASTGDRNIAIGYQSGFALTAGSRNILLGSSINFPSNTGSNQMTIGNIIYATGVDGTGTTVSTGSVGIKTNAPARSLHVAGEVRITDLTTDNPTVIVGADGDGDLDDITVGTGLTLSAGVLTTTGGAPVVGANNGLSLSGTTVQWGGPLIQQTTIDQDGFYYLHKDGRKIFFRYNTGNPVTDQNVTGTVDITGKGAAPSINLVPSEDNILTLRGHDGTSTFYDNAMFFGTYTTATYGSWIQTRSEGAYTTHFPLNLNANGGKIGVGRDPQSDQLDAHFTISRSLSGSTITGILLHIENTEGNKAAMSFGKGYDIIDGEAGYFDSDDIMRVTNRNTSSTSSVRFAVGGETSDEVVIIPAGTGFGSTGTGNIKSTIQDEGSLGLKTTTSSGDLTLNETHCIIIKNAGSAGVTFTLPDPDSCPGRFYWIMNHTAQTITLSRNVTSGVGGVVFNTIGDSQWAMMTAVNGNGWRGMKQTSL